MDLVPVIKITRMHGGRRVPAAADLVLAGRPITRVERVTAVQGARNRGFLLSACEGWALGWTLAALVALAVQTLLGLVSNALCLLAPADALLQVELLLRKLAVRPRRGKDGLLVGGAVPRSIQPSSRP